jgi:hypothetical protein
LWILAAIEGKQTNINADNEGWNCWNTTITSTIVNVFLSQESHSLDFMILYIQYAL